METRTYTTIDREALGWPQGPWDNEHIDWTHRVEMYSLTNAPMMPNALAQKIASEMADMALALRTALDGAHPDSAA